MDDSISRQAVLDLLEDTNNGWIINEVLQLPSVNPQHSGDLISRQDAIKAIDEKAKRIKNEDTLNGLAGAVGILFDLPSVIQQEPCNDITAFKEDVLDAISRIGLLKSGTKEVQVVAECLRAVEALSPVKPQEPKWIPIGKESPVAFEKVLVTYRLHYDDSIHVGIGNTTSNVNGRYYWCLDEQDYKTWDILAWMPLPKPYEPQESEG